MGGFGSPNRFSKWLDIKDQALAWKQLWVSKLFSITTINNKKFRTFAMATVVSQHARHLGRPLEFFKSLIFSKKTVTVLEISRKHVFRASNTNIIKNKVGKEFFQNAKKLQFSFSNFILHN